MYYCPSTGQPELTNEDYTLAGIEDLALLNQKLRADLHCQLFVRVADNPERHVSSATLAGIISGVLVMDASEEREELLAQLLVAAECGCAPPNPALASFFDVLDWDHVTRACIKSLIARKNGQPILRNPIYSVPPHPDSQRARQQLAEAA